MAKFGRANIFGAFSIESGSPLTGKLTSVSSQQRLSIMSDVLDVAAGGVARSIRIRATKAEPIEVRLDRVAARMACLDFLLDQSPKIRHAFVVKLGETDWRERGPLLGRVVLDPDRQVQRAARALLRDLNWPVDTVVSGLELLQPSVTPAFNMDADPGRYAPAELAPPADNASAGRLAPVEADGGERIPHRRAAAMAGIRRRRAAETERICRPRRSRDSQR